MTHIPVYFVFIYRCLMRIRRRIAEETILPAGVEADPQAVPPSVGFLRRQLVDSELKPTTPRDPAAPRLHVMNAGGHMMRLIIEVNYYIFIRGARDFPPASLSKIQPSTICSVLRIKGLMGCLQHLYNTLCHTSCWIIIT